MNESWSLWLRQMLAVARLELKTSFSPRRAMPVYLLAAMPFVIFAGHAIAAPARLDDLFRRLRPDHLRGRLPDFRSAAGAVLRLRRGVPEPVPRRGGAEEPALLVSRAGAPRGSGGGQVSGRRHHRGGDIHREHGAYLSGAGEAHGADRKPRAGCRRDGPASGVRGRDGARLPRLRRGIPADGRAVPQPDHPGDRWCCCGSR